MGSLWAVLFRLISEKMLHTLVNRESEYSKMYLAWEGPDLYCDSLIIQDLVLPQGGHWGDGRCCDSEVMAAGM